MATDPNEFIPTRASLLTRLKHWDDQEGWKRFFETYWKLIYSVSRKAGLADAEAQDVVQETILSVAKKMPTFKYDPTVGSFKGWLMRLTGRRVIDHLRKRHHQSHGQQLPCEENLSTSLAEHLPDPSALDLESIWDEEWSKHVMDAAMEKAKRQVSPTQFQIFYLHIVKNIPAKQVAESLEVKLTEVYFAKYKVGRLIQKEIKNLEKKMI